jgi:GGDEF domain-containing protein
MLWYIAFIAAVNLAAGYYWGAYLRRCPRCVLMREAEILALSPAANRIDRRSAPSKIDEAAGVVPADESAAAGQDSVGDLIDGAAESTVPVDPVTGLVTREFAEQLLEKLTAAGVGSAPATIALVEVNRASQNGKEPTAAVDERLFRGVSTVVRQSLDRKDTAASFAAQQLLLLLPEEDVHQATRQAEEFRQRVASTEFVADGRPFQTTVTCALVEIAPESTGPRLFEFLEEALGEAKRYGGNRTFMHDGNSPTPVVPSELTVAPQQLAI